MDYTLFGMSFGDESKGSYTDWLTAEMGARCIVKYNGGAQASHTVVTPSGTLHKFSQLGSGMFHQGIHTFITENVVINPDSLYVELGVFARKTGTTVPQLIKRLHIHRSCIIVTPYHKLMNRLRELAVEKESRRGTVGTGVSEAAFLASGKGSPHGEKYRIYIHDLYEENAKEILEQKLKKLQEYVSCFYEDNLKKIKQNTLDHEDLSVTLDKETDHLLAENAYRKMADIITNSFSGNNAVINYLPCLYDDYGEIYRMAGGSPIICEGAQGLLLDRDFGIHPNTTYLDTTGMHAPEDKSRKRKKIGIIKAVTSRHGPGVFPTESEILNRVISDKNQEETIWNGKIRFGWADMVLLRYAQKINQADELFLSGIDLLDSSGVIQVCNSYIYDGEPDSEFESIFRWRRSTYGDTIIEDILQPHRKLGEYLAKCRPSYVYTEGWQEDTRQSRHRKDLPENLIGYTDLITSLSGVKITAVSVGPTRENKIWL